jgi:sortase A
VAATVKLAADRKLRAVKPRGDLLKSREKEEGRPQALTGLSLLTESPPTSEPTTGQSQAPAESATRTPTREGPQSPPPQSFDPRDGGFAPPPPEDFERSAGRRFSLRRIRGLEPPPAPFAPPAPQPVPAAKTSRSKRPRRHARPRTKAVVLKRVAYAFLGAGVLLLSFVAYQLWGTAFYEGHAQDQLRHELADRYGIRSAAGTAPTDVPENLQAEFGTTAHVAKPAPDPPVGQPVGLMTIPGIGMSNDAIIEGTGESQLEEGPGHYQGTPLPGQAGNSAIAGHRTTYAAPFFNLNLLQPGDPIFVVTPQGHFEYMVVNQEVVDPGDTAVLDAGTLPLLTLTTCNPRYSDTQRLVVVAVLHSSILASASAAANPSTGTAEPHGSPGGGGTLKEVIEALCWGALAVVVIVLTAIGWRRLWGLKAGLVLLVGLPAFVAALLVCFAHVSLALPQTF